MKILFLVSRYAPHALGGAERVAATLAGSLIGMGHEVVVLTTAQDGDPAERTVDGVRVRSVPLRNVYDFSKRPPRLLKPVWHFVDSSNPLMKSSVAAVLREERPDVMHSHLVTGFSPSAWDVAADLGIPIVHSLHDHYVICARSSMAVGGVACRDQHLDCALLSGPRVRAARRVDAVVGVSRYVLDRHRQFGAFTSNRSWVIPNPCHLVGHDSERSPAVSGRGSTVRFGFMARLELNKGVDRLLDATRTLPASGWTLTLAGSGDPEFTAGLRREYERRGISFVGRVADPADFLRQIDVLVAPSTFPETFGMSVAEALAMGVPVIASTVAALPELIEDGRNGFLFDPAEEGALARVLGRIVADPALLSGMADVCRSSVVDLETERVTRRYVEVYEAVTRR